MGLFLAILSLVLSFFSPADMFPALGPYHLQALLMLPALAYSVALVAMRPSRMEPTLCFLVMAIWGASAMSLLSKFRLGNAYDTLFQVGPQIICFFLVHINCFSLKRVKILGAVLMLSALVMAIQGILAFHTGYQADQLLYFPSSGGSASPPRVRALGFLNDPNDFAQFLLVGLALLGLFWAKRNPVRNLVLLVPPALTLIYAVYLTFSRGAIFGLLALIFMAFYRKGTQVVALFATIVSLVLMLVMQFGGGREISLAESSAGGRVEAWGAGIGMLKSYPLFGVGFGQFTKHHELTAHNSFVLCFAELGLVGFFFYLAAILAAGIGLHKLTALPVKTPEDASFNSAVMAVRTAFAVFLSTCWFLSRTYSIPFYVLLGLAASMIQMRRPEFPMVRLSIGRLITLTLASEVLVILTVYALVRIRNF